MRLHCHRCDSADSFFKLRPQLQIPIRDDSHALHFHEPEYSRDMLAHCSTNDFTLSAKFLVACAIQFQLHNHLCPRAQCQDSYAESGMSHADPKDVAGSTHRGCTGASRSEDDLHQFPRRNHRSRYRNRCSIRSNHMHQPSFP